MSGSLPGYGLLHLRDTPCTVPDQQSDTDTGLIPASPACRRDVRSPAPRGRLLTRPLRLCLVAPSERLIGGQSVQAAQLRQALGATGAVRVTFVATDSRLPAWIRVVSRVRFVRTVVRLVFFVPRLAWAMRATEVTHVFTAAYWSFT